MIRKLGLSISIFFFGCASIPGNIKPVKGFDVERYKGTWYEIA
jgi:lipocalin